MSKYYDNIPVKPETKEKIKSLVLEECLRVNPELKHIPLSYDFLVNKMIDYYLAR